MNDSSKKTLLQGLHHIKLADETDCLHKTVVQANLQASFSPLRNGQISARASGQLESYLLSRMVAVALADDPAPRLREHDPRYSIRIAKIVGTDSYLLRPLDAWSGHAFFQGTTGSGKSTAEVVLADRFVEKKISVIIFARKESGRFLRRFPNAILLRPHQLPVNFAGDIIGDPKLFFAEWVPIVARGVGVRSDYIPTFLNVAMRSHAAEQAKGRKLSLRKLEKVFYGLGRRGNRRCATIAAALGTFNLFLGDTARIETAPAWENQYPVIILDREGAPPAYRACLDGMMQHRFQAQAAQDGYTHHLRRVIFYDEAGLEFLQGYEAQQAGSGFVSAAKRDSSQMRSYGVFIIYCGQSYGITTNDIKDNTNIISAFQTVSTDDIREIALRMNLTESQKLRFPTLPPGRAYFFAPDLPAAVEVQFDHLDLGPYPSEEQIAARMNPVLQELRNRTVFTREDPIEPLDTDELLGVETPSPAPIDTQAPITAFTGALLTDHLAFLRDVARHQDDGIAARFYRLGFGGSKGNRIKEELITLGLIEVVEIRKSTVGAATKLLRLTPLAKTLPGL